MITFHYIPQRTVYCLGNKPILTIFPVGLIKKIEAHQQKNLISSFVGAVYELIQKGLTFAS